MNTIYNYILISKCKACGTIVLNFVDDIEPETFFYSLNSLPIYGQMKQRNLSCTKCHQPIPTVREKKI